MQYTQQEIDFLLSVSWMCRKKVTQLFNEKFNKSKKHEAIKRFYVRRGLKRDFSRSPRVANSGTFKKGQKAHNEMAIGDEYIHPVNGLVMVKTEQGRVFKHYHVWGEPVPKGYNLTFKDGNKLNCTKDNLILVHQSAMLRFNQSFIKKATPQNRESLLLLAQIKDTLHKRAS